CPDRGPSAWSTPLPEPLKGRGTGCDLTAAQHNEGAGKRSLAKTGSLPHTSPTNKKPGRKSHVRSRNYARRCRIIAAGVAGGGAEAIWARHQRHRDQGRPDH